MLPCARDPRTTPTLLRIKSIRGRLAAFYQRCCSKGHSFWGFRLFTIIVIQSRHYQFHRLLTSIKSSRIYLASCMNYSTKMGSNDRNREIRRNSSTPIRSSSTPYTLPPLTGWNFFLFIATGRRWSCDIRMIGTSFTIFVESIRARHVILQTQKKGKTQNHEFCPLYGLDINVGKVFTRISYNVSRIAIMPVSASMPQFFLAFMAGR